MGSVIRLTLYATTLLTWAASLGALWQWSVDTGNLMLPALAMGWLTIAVTPTIGWTPHIGGHAVFGVLALTPYLVTPGSWVALPLALIGFIWVMRTHTNTLAGAAVCPSP